MSRSMPVRKRDRTRADIHDGPEQNSSNLRPDTLMRDRLPPARQNPLQRTAGPYIWVNHYQNRPFVSLPLIPQQRKYRGHHTLVRFGANTDRDPPSDRNLAERQVIDSMADVATTFAQQGVTLTCRCSFKPRSFGGRPSGGRRRSSPDHV